MKKRLVSILAVVLACAMLVSCSDSSVQTKDGDQKTTESSSEVESGALLPDGEIGFPWDAGADRHDAMGISDPARF